MKKIILLFFFLEITAFCYSQEDSAFVGIIHNDEQKLYIEMNFIKKNIIIPRQEIFGSTPGYIASNIDYRKWIITDVEIKGNVATLDITNDYGSEDLVATLTRREDGSYVLEHIKGNSIKFAIQRKWVKIPKIVIFNACKK